MSIGLKINKEKIGALLAYICCRVPDMHLRKLLKILYLIDEESVRLRAIPVTWLEYQAWAKGPVAHEVYDAKNGAFSSYIRCEKKEDDKWHVNAVAKHPFLMEKDLQQASEWEMDLVDRIIDRCKDMSADQLTDETHTPDSLWSKVVAENKIDFGCNPRTDYVVDLNLLNETEEQKAAYEDAEDCMRMQAFLNGCC